MENSNNNTDNNNIDNNNNKYLKNIKLFNKTILTGIGIYSILPALATIALIFLGGDILTSLYNFTHKGLFGLVIGIAMIAIMVLDAGYLTQLNYKNVPAKWWALLPPVYLWKRANVLNKSKSTFWAYLLIAILGSVLEFGIGVFIGLANSMRW